MNQWISVKDDLPDIGEEVAAGFWFYDTWLREDIAWKFMWGNCSLIEDKNLSHFPLGKRWITFGCSHNQITHWMRLSEFPAIPHDMLKEITA